ncbi:AMP-binding enzyme, partial [Kitasatospora sp. NPDC001574]
VAYLVPRAGAAAGTLDADVRTYLSSRVPGHLVPSRITVVPELVLTASGKVDRAGSHRRHSAAPAHPPHPVYPAQPLRAARATPSPH